jgi:hypothetical protein
MTKHSLAKIRQSLTQIMHIYKTIFSSNIFKLKTNSPNSYICAFRDGNRKLKIVSMIV